MSNKKRGFVTVQDFLEKRVPEGMPKALSQTLEEVPLEGTISSDRLRKKLKITPNALTRRLLRIEKEHPELINREFVKGKQTYEVSFAKAEIKETTSLEERLHAMPTGIKAKNLYLGEMAFGTKAYDPDAMTGLAYFIKYNGQSDLTNVMMLGGLFPRIPEYYSVSGSEDMRFLDKDPTKSGLDPNISDIIDHFAQKASLGPEDANYFKEHVEGKIKTRFDASNAVRPELEKLAEVLSAKTEWHYQHGEEDRKNIQVAKEILIAAAEEKKKEEYNQYVEEIENLERNLKHLDRDLASSKNKSEFMTYVSEKLKASEKQQDLKEYLSVLTAKKINEFGLDKNEKTELLNLVTSEGVTKEKIFEEAKKAKDLESKLAKEKEQLKQKIGEQEHKVNAVNRHSAASGFYKGTKQYKIEADEEEALFRIAKKDYNNFIYGAVPGKMDIKRFHVHSSAFNELTDPLSNEKAKQAPTVGDDEEYEVVTDPQGIVYLLAHNPNMLNSNATTKKDLQLMKREVKRMVKMGDVLGESVPDVTLSSHGQGGFRYQPQIKFRETIVHGQNRAIPEVVVHMKLPTFQSVPKLEKLRKRGLKNAHTKRYNAGCFATGAVFHTIYENGRFTVDFIDEHTLRDYAAAGKQIDEKKSKLKDARKQGDEGLASTLKTEIDQLESQLTLDKLVKIELDGDTHMGSANEPGRRSNYEVVDAAQKFQRTYGLPDIVVESESIHSEIKGVCHTNEQYLGLTPKEAEDLFQSIKSDKTLSAEERLNRVIQVAKAQIYATPITHLDVTLREWKNRTLPYFLEVLDKGGRTIFVSGNHYNKSGPGRDEAEAKANMVPAKYKDQVEVFHARGDSIGCGETVLPGGKTLYATHKLKEGPDEFVGALEQILRQGITADLVLHFDRHHGGGAYADNTAYAMAPGRQTWNKYVDQISKMSSPSGIVNVYLPRDKTTKFVRWEWALGDCLENYFMEPQVSELTLLSRKSYLPAVTERKTKK